MESKLCGACGHSAKKHVSTAAGTFSCIVVEHSVSTRGIIGVRSQDECPCENYAEAITPCRLCGKPVFLLTEPTSDGRPPWERSSVRAADELIHIRCVKEETMRMAFGRLRPMYSSEEMKDRILCAEVGKSISRQDEHGKVAEDEVRKALGARPEPKKKPKKKRK